MRGAPSPYIWSGTDQYKSGKYVRDHDYEPDVVDEQLGCAGLILAMQAIDASIGFGVIPPAAPMPSSPPPSAPSPLPTQPTSIWAARLQALLSILANLTKGK